MGVDLIDALRRVNSLLFNEVESESRLFKAVADALTRLDLRGAVMLRSDESMVLTIREAVTHPVIRRLELLTGLRTVGHRIDASRISVYREVLATGEAQYVEDCNAILEELAPALARPFLGVLKGALKAYPGVYAPLRSRGKVVGLLNASGLRLTHDDLPAMDVLAAGISLGLDNIRLRKQTQQGSVPIVPLPVGREVAAEVEHLAARPGAVLTGDEARKLREALQVFEEQRAALDHHAIVTVTDAAGCITYANDRFCALSGYGRDELLGRTHRVVKSGVHSADYFAEMWATITRGEVWHGELCNRAKDGHLYWLSATIVPMLASDGRPREYIAFRTDISTQKDAETALRRARDAADAANRAKSTFLAHMSHEIRTPMNAILGMTRLALETKPAGELRENLETVLDSATSLLVTLNDILDFSKVEAGKVSLEVRPFDLEVELEHALRPFSYQARARGLTLERTWHEGVRGVALGDAHRLRQVINNVVGNALKFTHTGGVTVVATREHDLVTLVVKDTGIGIPPDMLEHIFNAFEQADVSTTRRYGGSGLGLSIARSLAKLMGGDVAVDSAPGQGTTVTIQARLPQSSASPVDVVEAPPAGCALRVLVAEDNLVNQRLVQRLLERWGHSVEVVPDGKAAVARALEGRFDAILMDLDMPLAGGLDATREIRRLEKVRVPIIALTANAIRGDRERCLEAGMDDYVAKPINPDTLLRVLTLHGGLDAGAQR